MNFIKVETYDQLSALAADLIAKVIKEKPDCVLGLATGSSPLGTYSKLIDMYNAGELDFSRASSINLDEYLGLPGTNPQSYRYFMNENLFSKVNIKLENTNVPCGICEDPDAECERYEKLIDDMGGIDIQLLGIGLDGHIGFNEPDSVFTGPTHVVDLDESTIEANARFFESRDEVPRKALTMGMRGIMQAKKVLLIANGKKKLEVIEKTVNGPITPMLPASILQLHPDVTIIYSEN